VKDKEAGRPTEPYPVPQRIVRRSPTRSTTTACHVLEAMDDRTEIPCMLMLLSGHIDPQCPSYVAFCP
jgi:hypothetical protein